MMEKTFMKKPEPQIIIYQTDDGQTKLRVKMEDETVWLTQDQMAELFDKGRTTITEHINNAFKEGELDEKSVCREFRRTGSDSKEYVVKHYNLDVIISVGYRVKSLRGTQFRIWRNDRHPRIHLEKKRGQFLKSGRANDRRGLACF